MSTLCGSFAYSAPELISGKSDYSGFATDCWSLGVILFCVVCRRLPYERDDLLAIVRGKEVKSLEFPDEVSKGILIFPFFKVFSENNMQMKWSNLCDCILPWIYILIIIAQPEKNVIVVRLHYDTQHSTNLQNCVINLFVHPLMIDAKVVIMGLLETNPLKRFTCVDLLRHEWCKGYHAKRNQPQQLGKQISRQSKLQKKQRGGVYFWLCGTEWWMLI